MFFFLPGEEDSFFCPVLEQRQPTRGGKRHGLTKTWMSELGQELYA